MYPPLLIWHKWQEVKYAMFEKDTSEEDLLLHESKSISTILFVALLDHSNNFLEWQMLV